MAQLPSRVNHNVNNIDRANEDTFGSNAIPVDCEWKPQALDRVSLERPVNNIVERHYHPKALPTSATRTRAEQGSLRAILQREQGTKRVLSLTEVEEEITKNLVNKEEATKVSKPPTKPVLDNVTYQFLEVSPPKQIPFAWTRHPLLTANHVKVIMKYPEQPNPYPRMCPVNRRNSSDNNSTNPSYMTNQELDSILRFQLGQAATNPTIQKTTGKWNFKKLLKEDESTKEMNSEKGQTFGKRSYATVRGPRALLGGGVCNQDSNCSPIEQMFGGQDYKEGTPRHIVLKLLENGFDMLLNLKAIQDELEGMSDAGGFADKLKKTRELQLAELYELMTLRSLKWETGKLPVILPSWESKSFLNVNELKQVDMYIDDSSFDDVLIGGSIEILSSIMSISKGRNLAARTMDLLNIECQAAVLQLLVSKPDLLCQIFDRIDSIQSSTGFPSPFSLAIQLIIKAEDLDSVADLMSLNNLPDNIRKEIEKSLENIELTDNPDTRIYFLTINTLTTISHNFPNSPQLLIPILIRLLFNCTHSWLMRIYRSNAGYAFLFFILSILLARPLSNPILRKCTTTLTARLTTIAMHKIPDAKDFFLLQRITMAMVSEVLDPCEFASIYGDWRAKHGVLLGGRLDEVFESHGGLDGLS